MADELEPPIPEILWKYRQWDDKGHAEAMIEMGEVYFAKPEELNDPLDFHWRETRPETVRERRLFAKDLAKQRLRNRSARNRKVLSNLWVSQLGDEYAAAEDGVMDSYTKITQGVLSCSAINDDFLMWSHYSSGHQGICVGLLPDKIPIPFRSCIYQKEPPIVDYRAHVESNPVPFVDAARSKSDRWAYEQEWRTLREPPGPIQFPGCVASVVFGLRTDDATRDKVRACTERSGQQINLFQVRKVRSKYELEVVPYEQQRA